jgi:protein-S-isoprenylcysteine O-methyltransferase Ste14
MSHFNMPEQLWDLANLVTGFAVVQTVATIITVAKGELQGLKGTATHWIAVAGTAGFAACYIIAIMWCGIVGASLDNNVANSHVWTVVTFGRVFGVLLFTLVALGTIWGHWRYEASVARMSEATSGSHPQA